MYARRKNKERPLALYIEFGNIQKYFFFVLRDSKHSGGEQEQECFHQYLTILEKIVKKRNLGDCLFARIASW